MTRPNITPGNWTVNGSQILGPELGGEQAILGTLYGAACEDCEGYANARAIAAVPALLAALETIHANAAESPEWIRRHTVSALTAAGYQFHP